MKTIRVSSQSAVAWMLLTTSCFGPALFAAPILRPTELLQHVAVDVGQTNTFKVNATGSMLKYQWRLDGRDLPSQTNQTLVIGPALPADEGDYTVEVRSPDGAVVSDPARLWVVPTASELVKDNYTNSTGQRLPYFYLLPQNYDPHRRYPLFCLFHGTPGDETMITNAVPGQGPGYGNFPALKVTASYAQQTRDPVITFYPTRRKGDLTWTDAYLKLVSSVLDKLLVDFNIDTNRVYVAGGSEGVHAAWDMIAMRPTFFTCACLAAGWQGNAKASALTNIPIWAWCAADDSLLSDTRTFVRMLRMAGGSPVYTEYQTGGHLNGIFMGMVTPVIVDWVLGQTHTTSLPCEPLLSVTEPSASVRTTGATHVTLRGSAAALECPISQVAWTNTVNRTGGKAEGSTNWTAQAIPLAGGKTNLLIVTATTTSWSFGYQGNTTFSQSVFVFSTPVIASLSLQAPGAILNWTGGVGPFHVQRASTLAGADWIEIFTNATPPLNLTLDQATAFYRITGQ